MSLGDALKFEKSWVGDIWKGITRDPKRLILGVDPLSTKAWNAVLGRHDKPVVGDFGGPTKESYQNAQDKGIKTGTASTLHGIAKAIAGTYGAYGAAGGLGNAATSLGSTGATGATAGGVEAGASGATSAGYGVAGGAAEAIPEVVVTGTTGSGAGAAVGAGAGAGGATAANSNGNSNNWRDQLQQQMPGQQDDQQAQADENRRQLEAMIEQERLRREAFRRNQIARAMG